MVECGAQEMPEETLARRARARTPRDPGALRGAGGAAPRSQASRRSSIRTSPPSSRHGTRAGSASGSSPTASARRAAVEEIEAELCPPLTMELDGGRHRPAHPGAPSLTHLLEQARLEAVIEPVRAQFESELRALTDAEQDSKELKSAKRDLLFGRIVDEVQLPFPVGTAPAATPRRPPPPVKDTMTKPVRQEGSRGDLQGSRAAEDRRREAPARTAAGRTRSGRSAARSTSRPARTARPSSRADRRRS